MIPNFNYARYIGETIDSVRSQAGAERGVEIVVCDNASTDDSVAVVEAYRDDRIRLAVNPCNVGFAANLERVANLARGRRMLLLSSDDRIAPGALAAYDRLETALGGAAARAVWGSSQAVIDSAGHVTGRVETDPRLWRDATVNEALSRAVGHPVREIPAAQLLRRSLELLRSPLPFAATCYPRALHDEVGGYAGGRLVNPDKWFLWKLLAVADMAYTIDADLFDYRVHGAGQNAQEQQSGALKHLTDQYIATFNLPDNVLAKAGLDRETLARAFIEQDIALRGLVAVAAGNRVSAHRAVNFGLAAYPKLARANAKVWLLRALIALGPLGTRVAQLARSRAQARWRARESDPTAS
ncbi:MAG: glycosyltransferase [Proteobacteria bacterium]|nr:glycosyltransferase [Pseudomonadota bacterium]